MTRPTDSDGAENRACPRAPSLLRNWVSLTGILLAASSFFAVACLIVLDLSRGFTSPYLGILTYLVAPAFLFAGLFATLVGVLWERRRRRKLSPGAIPSFPRIDLNVPRQRRILVVATIAAVLFLLATVLGSYGTYQFTDSVTFCGKTCHTVMRPEYTAYQNSPHARVACAQCHIGPGAGWFVKSKLSGVYQVYATITDKYPRPIPTPIKNLRPAQDTCEQCHWPRKFFGAVERTYHFYMSDERNSPWAIQMLVKIGGGDPSFGPVGGIHWHMNIANKMEYIASDRERQVIPWVRLTDSQGRVTVYQSTDKPLTPEQIRAAQPRVFDCIDCHNRPTHIYRSPADAVNLAISLGRINSNLPYARQQTMSALMGEYATDKEARNGIAASLDKFYAAEHPGIAKPDPAEVAQAVASVQDIYAHNFFPDMKVNWRVYPDNLGHWEFPGCFRCHDGKHAAADGRTITRDCNACHTIVAQGPPDKMETRLSGLEFAHPFGIPVPWQQMNCSDCHDGGT